jgi:hypothetical protein
MGISPFERPPVRPFYDTWRFITVFRRTIHWSLSEARSIQSVPPHSLSLEFILILSIRLLLCLPSSLLPYYFPTKILHAFLFASIRATHSVYFTVLDLIILITFSTCCKLQNAVFSSRLSARSTSVQMFSSAPCSQICSSLNDKTNFNSLTEPHANIPNFSMNIFLF